MIIRFHIRNLKIFKNYSSIYLDNDTICSDFLIINNETNFLKSYSTLNEIKRQKSFIEFRNIKIGFTIEFIKYNKLAFLFVG